MSVKNFSHAQNYQNLEGYEKFYVFWFFSPLYMYNSNTNSLIIVGSHLTKKERVLLQFVSLIDLINSL